MIKRKIIIDITSLLSTNILTGIQRVVIELALRLIRFNNSVILLNYTGISDKFKVVDNRSFANFAYDKDRIHKILSTQKLLSFKEFDSNFIILDIDSAWNPSCLPRSLFYRSVKNKGCKIITLVHDLIPFSFPHFWETYDKRFLLYISAVFEYSDEIVCTTNAVKNEMESYLNRLSIKKEISVIPLGCDFKKEPDLTNVSQSIVNLCNKNYLLIVSTLEPRKNHILLLQAFLDIYKNNDINLIIVGRLGWMYKKTLDLINSSGLLNKRIFVFNNANNDEVIYFYKKAFAFVFPSFAEGYGLPLVEALFYKCPVFASDIDVFKEISQGKAILFDNKDKNNLIDKLSIYLNDGKKYLNLKNGLNNFKIHSWDDTYFKLINIIKKLITNYDNIF